MIPGIHVVVVGNPFEGMSIYGPFPTGDEANDWAHATERQTSKTLIGGWSGSNRPCPTNAKRGSWWNETTNPQALGEDARLRLRPMRRRHVDRHFRVGVRERLRPDRARGDR